VSYTYTTSRDAITQRKLSVVCMSTTTQVNALDSVTTKAHNSKIIKKKTFKITNVKNIYNRNVQGQFDTKSTEEWIVFNMLEIEGPYRDGRTEAAALTSYL